ncbi:helix-turn-helix domain-containing protein [Saccharothrix sp. S26]|uniref:helix-turn-helix domain-containing protein n=1 Tax=Saccharothrix sp. S26 TaxID=2907215 RepID=UPI001F1E0B55|nr:helix-turn-helix domain-containing protein [Saccharothrix sp. S26]MCE6993461.1 helix-turn-helix domain-containing protein [Saccharothrix sp. S26]
MIEPLIELEHPDEVTRQASSRLEHAMAGARSPRTVLVVDGEEVEVPHALVQLLLHAVHQQAAGRRVRVVSPDSDEELTPNQAAKYLGISRPLLVKLLDDGTIPARTLPGSRHRRISVAALEHYLDRKVNRRARLSAAMNEIADAGLYERQD